MDMFWTEMTGGAAADPVSATVDEYAAWAAGPYDYAEVIATEAEDSSDEPW